MRYRRRRRNPSAMSQMVNLENPVLILAVAGVAIYAIYSISQGIKKAADAAGNAAAAAAGAVGGALTGNNALTQGTPYAGAGVAGTLGAATNDVLGGVPQSLGESIGGAIYSLFHGSNTPAASTPGSATAAPAGATGATSPNVTGMTGVTGATYQ